MFWTGIFKSEKKLYSFFFIYFFIPYVLMTKVWKLWRWRCVRWVFANFVGTWACGGLLRPGTFPFPSKWVWPEGQDYVSPIFREGPEGRPGGLSPRFSSVQFSCSVVSDSLWPHGLKHIRPPCPSPTPGACSNSCPLNQWWHPTISSSVIPFSSHLQSFPALGSFPVSQFFTSSGQTIGVWGLS